MSAPLASNDPLAVEIVRLLPVLPETWTKFNADVATAVTQSAILLLAKAGLIEIRIILEANMESLGETLRLRFRASGDYRNDEFLRHFYKSLPSHWTDEEGGLRGKVRLFVSGVHSLRLTEDGANSRGDLASNGPGLVVAFVLRRDAYTHRGDVRPEVILEERVHASNKPQPDARPGGTVVTQAVASASVGDVVINNVVDTAPLAAALRDALDAVLQLKTPAPPASEPNGPPSGACADPITLDGLELVNPQPAKKTIRNRISELRNTPEAAPPAVLKTRDGSPIFSYAALLPFLEREWPGVRWPPYAEVQQILRHSKSGTDR